MMKLNTLLSRRMFSTKARENVLVVLGGSGFVGSNVVQEALKQGMDVVSLSRSGKPKWTEPWVEKVTWLRTDVQEEPAADVKEALSKAKGVVSCLGAFGSNAFMEKVNGDCNVAMAQRAHAEGVPKYAYISAHDYQHMPGFIAPGYFKGKRTAEAAISHLFKGDATILRPGMVYGPRKVGSVSLPLGAIGAPLSMLTNNALVQSLNKVPVLGAILEAGLVPPVPATAVARASVDAIVREPAAAEAGPRILDVPQILAFK